MGMFDFFSQIVNPHHQMVYAENGNKGSLTHEILAGAAGFEAIRLLESHHATATGQPVQHSLFKEILAGIAAGEIDKLVETHSLVEKGYDVEKLKADATSQALAHYDKQYGSA
ncbi:hypothetical protein BJ742DRAFT_792960 [Cladochytrium replicatum]|nr:hypothetical protein BJ742DRAFT_792960 [Cladochytrium replicatum]